MNRIIQLPNGGNMVVTLTDQFLELVRARFLLPYGAPVSDDQIRIFFAETTKEALDKADVEL